MLTFDELSATERFRLKHIKKINVTEAIKTYVGMNYQLQKGKEQEAAAREMKEKINIEYSSFFISKVASTHIKINDTLDVVVEITSKLDSEFKESFDLMFPEQDRDTVKEILKLTNDNYELIKKSRRMTNAKKAINSIADVAKKTLFIESKNINLNIEELEGKLTSASQDLLKKMDKKKKLSLKIELHKLLNGLKGSIIYI